MPAHRIAKGFALGTGIAAGLAAGFAAASGAALFTVALDSRSPHSTFAHKHDPAFARYDQSWRHSDTAATDWFTQARQPMALRSRDGLMLHAWRFDPDTMHPLDHCYAIVMHGYTGEPEETAPWAFHYARLGFTVVCPAQRAHEHSEGRYVTMGERERQDLMQWVNRVVAHDPQARILLHGNSMGAAAVDLAAGDRHLAPNVRAAVSDSAYTNGMAQLQRSLAAVLHSPLALARPGVRVAGMLLRLRGGARLADTDVAAAVARARIPIAFVQGMRDEIVDPGSARRLYQAYGGPDGDLLEVPGARHTAEVETDPKGYWAFVDAFLAHHFPLDGRRACNVRTAGTL